MADVTLPQLGETVTEGTITRWFKKVGDTIAADEPLFEVSTDKVDTEVPSPVAGTITQILAQEGDTVPVGAVLAVIGSGDGSAAASPPAAAPAPAAAEPAAAEPAAPPAPAPAPAAAPPPAPTPAPEPAPVAAAPAPTSPPAPAAASAPAASTDQQPAAAPPPVTAQDGARGDNRLLSPVVRRLVADHGLNADEITGTGP